MPVTCRPRFLPMPSSRLANVRSTISRWLPTKRLLRPCSPGIPFVDVYELSCKVIMEGLKDLGFVKGDPMEAVKPVLCHVHALWSGAYDGAGRPRYGKPEGSVRGMTGQPKSTEFGRKSLRLGRKRETGFVLTIEPGVCFIPELMDL